MSPELDIQVDNDGMVKYREQGDKYLFWNRIYARGKDIKTVEKMGMDAS